MTRCSEHDDEIVGFGYELANLESGKTIPICFDAQVAARAAAENSSKQSTGRFMVTKVAEGFRSNLFRMSGATLQQALPNSFKILTG